MVFDRAKELECNALGMFTKNQRQWKAKPIEPEQANLFRVKAEEAGFKPNQILVHDSYLINLGHPDPEKRAISLEAFRDELMRVEQLGLRLLNFHPGSHLGLVEPDESLRLVGQCIDEALEHTEHTIAVIENTAGQGTNLGSTLEELARLYEMCRTKERVGFCLDTCHLHAAGYDLSTVEGLQKVLSRFDELIGLGKLCGMHLNDAKAKAGSRLDRHESLGEGTIGWACFDAIATDPRLCNIPLVLETVDSGKWKAEVARIRRATQS